MPGSVFSSTSRQPYSNVLITGWGAASKDETVIEYHRKRLGPYFETITFAKEAIPSDDELKAADVVYGLPNGSWFKSASQVPRLKLIQLVSAGSERVVNSPLWKDEKAKDIKLTSASGVHTGPIPQYFIATTLMLFHRLQQQILIGQNEKRWGTNDDIGAGQFIVELRGKTVGVLGYGHIGREAARLSVAFGAKVIAANSSGEKKPQDGYIIPGTGDPDGSLPEAWYSTSDPKSLAAFLAASDVVLLSLPSTPATRHILNAETLAHLKDTAVLVNIGRGDAIDTDALVAALDAGKLGGVALDVTEPEPLPAGHTLYGRKNVIITPHMSGRTEKYMEIALDIFEENLKRLQAGKELLNVVDVKRGY